ncbi:hypothetical protein [Nonomuraea typhae]|uniref:hypothetical protein n=1 Tax=Nonomuraea typhae TaxID=2603600 RepID=UPI0012FA3122|nr:hypothetical protein [Nonomuraea typhae]
MPGWTAWLGGSVSAAPPTTFPHRRTGLGDAAGAAELAKEPGHLPLALDQAATVIARLRLSYARRTRSTLA